MEWKHAAAVGWAGQPQFPAAAPSSQRLLTRAALVRRLRRITLETVLQEGSRTRKGPSHRVGGLMDWKPRAHPAGEVVVDSSRRSAKSPAPERSASGFAPAAWGHAAYDTPNGRFHEEPRRRRKWPTMPSSPPGTPPTKRAGLTPARPSPCQTQGAPGRPLGFPRVTAPRSGRTSRRQTPIR